MKESIETVPKEVLDIVLIRLKPQEILNLCETNKYFQRVVCKNERVWERLTYRDYPGKAEEYHSKEGSWFEVYKTLHHIQIKVDQLMLTGFIRLRGIPSTKTFNLLPENIKEVYRQGIRIPQLSIRFYPATPFFDSFWEVMLEYALPFSQYRDFYKPSRVTKAQVEKIVYSAVEYDDIL